MAKAATPSPSLADAIAANVRKRGPRCGVTLLDEQLAEPQRADFRAALGNGTIPSTAISKGLATLGHDLPFLTIQRHRRGDCDCPQ